MNDRKYPTGLFIIGFITNLLFRFFWLFVPGVVLLMIGIFVKSCLHIGLALFLLDIVISLIEQIRIRKTVLGESGSSDFKAFQDALSKEGNWKDNLGEFLNQKISDSQNEMESDDENEDE